MSKFDELVMPKIDTEDAHDMDPESAASIGWNACKKAILDILRNSIMNADMSTEIVDVRFIERIKSL